MDLGDFATVSNIFEHDFVLDELTAEEQAYVERVAIMTVDGGLSDAEAEFRAWHGEGG